MKKLYLFNMFQGSINNLGRGELPLTAMTPLAYPWYLKGGGAGVRGSLIFISTFHNNATLLAAEPAERNINGGVGGAGAGVNGRVDIDNTINNPNDIVGGEKNNALVMTNVTNSFIAPSLAARLGLGIGSLTESNENDDELFNNIINIEHDEGSPSPNGTGATDKKVNKLSLIKLDNMDSRDAKLRKLTNDRIKELEKDHKDGLKPYKGGYLSYLKNMAILGNIDELLELKLLESRLNEILISQLESDKLYALLVNIFYVEDGKSKGTSPMKSIIITGDSNISLIAQNILNAIIRANNEYKISDYASMVQVIWRNWLLDDEYNKLIEPVNRTKIVNEVLRDEATLKLDISSKLDKIKKIMLTEKYENYLEVFPKFDSITKLPLYDYSNSSDGGKILKTIQEIENKNTDIKVSVYTNGDHTVAGPAIKSGSDILYFVYDYASGKKRTICATDKKSWEISIMFWDSSRYPYPKWSDELVDDNKFVRSMGDYKFHVDNGVVNYWEKYYNFPDMIMGYNDKVRNIKIGSLDLETYSCEGNGLGLLQVYAGGCALSDGYNAFYYIDKDKGLHSGKEILHKMFEELFDYVAEDKKGRNGYTLYAHNLGRFDSVFLLKSLASAGYDLNAKWKENDILSVRVSDKNRKLNIKIMDSIKLVPTSLDKLLKSFECEINKGMFPHKFVSAEKLNYIGAKPDIKYYVDEYKINDKTLAGYADIPAEINIKEHCLDYLRKDVLGLLEVMNKISEHYYNEYGLNITKFSTLPSLSLALYGYWYYKDTRYSIKMIKGPLESFIRQSYFGGNSDIFVSGSERFVSEGYHYDMNSQYPNAMKNSMPTGNPVFSNNTDLNYYKLGFVFAKITPPSKDVLANLFIQRRNLDGSVTCPREPFFEYISTVDLRQGLEYGYKAEIVCGVNFPDACDTYELFGSFVDTLFHIKSTASDNVKRSIAKLSLNSTYGKFGQKDHEYTIKLLHKNKLEEVVSTYHYNYLAKISDTIYLIKYGPRLNERLRQLYVNNAKLAFNENGKADYSLVKQRGIPSAVQISAMISSYARTSINPLKNIAGNLAIASNTDSLILRKPLPDELIGKELGKWKLEHTFKNGVFVRPKLYCYEDADSQPAYPLDGAGKELIRKASGVIAAKLTYEDYANLAKGVNVLTNKDVFKLNWNKLEIEVVNIETKLKGLKE